MKIKYSLIVSVFLLIFWELCLAQWSTDPAENTPICTAPNNQYNPHIVVDEKGNAIIVWDDISNPGGLSHIYAQRLNRYGYKMWNERGVPVCTAREYKKIADVVSDGQGGAIVVWLDYKNWFYPELIEETDIYAQRIDSSGVLHWNAEGVPVCTAEKNQYDPKVVSNNKGGAFFVWDDHRSGWGGVYIQIISEKGERILDFNGKKANIENVYQPRPNAISNDKQGMIFTYGNRAQRINYDGMFLWPIDSIKCNQKGLFNKQIITDSHEGIMLVGLSILNQNDFYIAAQRVNCLGRLLWTDFGIFISNDAEQNSRPEIISDGHSGATIAWLSFKSTLDNTNLFFSRIDSSGRVLWVKSKNGLVLNWSINQRRHLVGDMKGSAVVKFEIARSDTLRYQYVQKIDQNGNFSWRDNGIIYSYFNTKIAERISGDMAADGFGGAIIVWDQSQDIYAQQVNSDGNLGEVMTAMTITKSEEKIKPFELHNYPNPFNSKTQIIYQIPEGGEISLKIYNLNGQIVKTLIDQKQKEGQYEIIWNGMDDNDHPVASGIYIAKLRFNNLNAIKKITLLQ